MSGLAIVDIPGTELTPEDIARLQHPATGGVILFSRNYVSRRQVQDLIQQIHALKANPLLVTVDQEGGRVQRFREGFTRLPAAAEILRYCAGDTEQARPVARELGWLMAAELRSIGVDFSFAPVLDLDYATSSVIGDRAFAQTAGQVSELATAWMLGAHEAGMASVGKHFPGHGAVAADSHHALPVDTRDLDSILQADVRPFRHLIANGLEAVMPAHIIYPQCDPQLAGFSRFWLQTILRGKLGFQGVIFSDDLSMHATDATGDYSARAQAALHAGCDSVLVCNNPEATDQILAGLLDRVQTNPGLARLYARPWSPNQSQLEALPRWQQAVGLAEKIRSLQGK